MFAAHLAGPKRNSRRIVSDPSKKPVNRTPGRRKASFSTVFRTCPNPAHMLEWGDFMQRKPCCFVLSCGAALIWLTFSALLSLSWIGDVSRFLPGWYVVLVVMGIALLPGCLMSAMFLSNLLHARPQKIGALCCEPITAIICARNEEKGIYRTITQIVA